MLSKTMYHEAIEARGLLDSALQLIDHAPGNCRVLNGIEQLLLVASSRLERIEVAIIDHEYPEEADQRPSRRRRVG